VNQLVLAHLAAEKYVNSVTIVPYSVRKSQMVWLDLTHQCYRRQWLPNNEWSNYWR